MWPRRTACLHLLCILKSLYNPPQLRGTESVFKERLMSWISIRYKSYQSLLARTITDECTTVNKSCLCVCTLCMHVCMSVCLSACRKNSRYFFMTFCTKAQEKHEHVTWQDPQPDKTVPVLQPAPPTKNKPTQTTWLNSSASHKIFWWILWCPDSHMEHFNPFASWSNKHWYWQHDSEQRFQLPTN